LYDTIPVLVSNLLMNSIPPFRGGGTNFITFDTTTVVVG